MNKTIQQFIPHIIAIVAFLVVCAAYFSPQLEGKVPGPRTDIVQYHGMSQEVREYKKETGETSLWTNSMFGGMPTYQINTVSEGNLLKKVEYYSRLGIKLPIGQFFLAMLCFYVLMVVLGVNHWLAAIGAIAFSFTTNNLILYEAGHETKLRALTYLPLVAAGVVLTFSRKKYLLGGSIFALGLGLNIMSNHIQMSYYFALTLLIFGVAQLIYAIKKNELVDFAKSAAVIIIAAILAVGTSASNLWITYEYADDTMRGEPILETEGAPTSSSETDGLEWEYAMSWSNGTIDLFASFIPGVAGGGSQELVGDGSAVVQDLRRKGARIPSEFYAPLYWGELPFTSGPIYFGAIMFFLFIMGLFLVKGPVKWWLGLGTLLTFFISMGHNMEGLNRFFFDYLPLFNKFRTPNSVLSIAAFLVPMLGIITLHKIVNEKVTKEEALKSLYIAVGICGAIALFFALMGSSFYTFTNPGDQRYVDAGYDLGAIISDRQSLMQSDAFRTLLLVLISGGLIWAYLQDKVKLPLLLGGIALLVVFDQWTVGRRYLGTEMFVNSSNYNRQFEPRPVDQQILQDTDLSYRVYDASESTFQSAKTSYFHKSIGGYHAAKLQRAQDIIDHHLTQGNQKVLDMLNTRYFIFPGGQDQGAQVQRNPNAMGNAWFISAFRPVANANEEIDALNSIDPKTEAAVHKEFNEYIGQVQPTGEGTITLTDYAPNHLTYQSNTPSDQFAVFSEVWYGPNKGWQAYIDGEAVDHIRVNYILRGMIVPSGQHTIEFKFDPQSFKTGKLISQIFSIIIVFGLLGLIGYRAYNLYQEGPAEEKPTSTNSSNPKATTRRKKKK